MTRERQNQSITLKITDYTKTLNGKPLERYYEGSERELRKIMVQTIGVKLKENGMEGPDVKEANYWREKFAQKAKDFDTINRIYRDLLVESARKTSLQRFRSKLKRNKFSK